MTLKMKPMIATLGLLAFAGVAHADATLKITSFRFTGPRDRTAEICGKVEGQIDPGTKVVITVDPGNNSGTYVTESGPDGKWCQVVYPVSGVADAALWNGNEIFSANVAVLARTFGV